MPIVEEENDNASKILDIDKLKHLISIYKFPLILAGIGLMFLLMGIVFAVKTQYASQEVVFSEATSSAKRSIRVDIEGAVINPGVYEFKEDERVSDALVSAGGLSADADREWITKFLNKAARLTDGGKIYIPSVAEVTSGQTQSSNIKAQNLNDQGNLLGVTAGKVNINTASQAELEALPGIGPVTAGKIISGRPYQTVEELKSKKVVGNALFDKIKDLLTVF